MQKKLQDASKQIANNRQEIINKLVQFSVTDMLLFWGTNKSLVEKQREKWEPVLIWAGKEFKHKYKTTSSLDVPEQNKSAEENLYMFLEKLNDKQLAALLSAALLMRSVLLASALVKGKIDAKEAFEASFAEELWQAEHWGIDEEAEQKRKEVYSELQAIESLYLY